MIGLFASTAPFFYADIYPIERMQDGADDVLDILAFIVGNEGEIFEQAGQHHFFLDHGETMADAIPGPGRKGHVFELGVFSVAQKAFRVKPLRIWEDFGIPMDEKRTDVDGSLRGNGVTTYDDFAV